MDVTLDEAKTYLRVTSNDEDGLIQGLIDTATKLVRDVARLDEDSEADEAVLRVAVLYTVAYLYEHREDADHNKLGLTLRALLFGVREADF